MISRMMPVFFTTVHSILIEPNDIELAVRDS
jgi:hypothetical protein